MKKFLIYSFILLNMSSALASSQTLLPKVENLGEGRTADNYNCTLLMKRFDEIFSYKIKPEAAEFNSIKRFYCALKHYNDNPYTQVLSENTDLECTDEIMQEGATQTVKSNDILGCAIITGRIKLYMYKMYIIYFTKLLSMLSGSLSILFVVIGGYKYMIGALQDDVGEAKTTITNALIGLAISTAALIIVNIVQSIFSS